MKPRQMQHVLSLQSSLAAHDEFLQNSQAQYKQYLAGEIETLDFQTTLVKQALSTKDMWAAELATGIGKTIIAARIAMDRICDGPVIYLCANPTAIGDAESGIINKFYRVFNAHEKDCKAIGERNDFSRANDVNFLTPGTFVHRLDENPKKIIDLLERCSLFVVDEAHHFPLDTQRELKVYGRILDLAQTHVKNGLIVAMTGTWDRFDRKKVMGRSDPDVRMTVQDAVDLGRCPEIYGIQVMMDLVAKGSTKTGELIDYKLDPTERQEYQLSIAECMATTYEKYPVPMAAFANTQKEARQIAAFFNQITGLNQHDGLAVLTAQTKMEERQNVVRRILNKKQAGYITCAVGEEALDLPPLETVHLIRRTQSVVRNAQAIGRALRVFDEKKRALIVDYQMMVESYLPHFVGLTVDQITFTSGSRIDRVINGGPVVAQNSYPLATLQGVTMQEERALIVKRNMSPAQLAQIQRQAEEEERRKAWEDGRPERENTLHSMIDVFLEHSMRIRYADFSEFIFPVEIVQLPVEVSFDDAFPILEWWPIRKIPQRYDKFCKNLENHPRGYFASWGHYVANWRRNSDNTMRHTVDCFNQALFGDDPRTWKELKQVPDAEIERRRHNVTTVILAAVLQSQKDGGEFRWRLDENCRTLDDGTYRSQIIREYLRETEGPLPRDVSAAIWEHFHNLGFHDWHHRHTNTLPVNPSRLSKMLTVASADDFAAYAGILWTITESAYRLVQLCPRIGNVSQSLVQASDLARITK